MDRRRFLGAAAGAGAAVALTPQWLRALRVPGGGLHQPSLGPVIQRAIPSTGERLPVVGLSFSNHPACADHGALREVLRTMVENGGTVFDAMHGNGSAEQFHADLATGLGVQDKLFWSTRGTAPGEGGGPPEPGPLPVRQHIDRWLAWTKRSHMDLVMLPPQGDASHLAALKAEKQAGRVRYIGVQVIGDGSYPQLEAVMRSEPIDFIGVDYDVSNRGRVEQVILPLALERKIGVMAFFPFGNNGGVSCGSGLNLFGRVGTRPLPEWAAEFDAKTWSHFFLKYVISHPAITVARVGTTKPHHMLDNMGGGVGRLPDEATRRRMAAFIDALPPVVQVTQLPNGLMVLPAEALDRLVGRYRTGDGAVITVRRYGTMLVATPGADPESVLIARSATRFSLGHRGPGLLEFQLPAGSDEKATGVIYERDGRKLAASRVR